MSITPLTPSLFARGRVTWVKSQWKLYAYPGHFSVEINRDEDEVVILFVHDVTLSDGCCHGEGRMAFTYQYKPDPQRVSTNEFLLKHWERTTNADLS
jgi:hypothetical protein